MRLLEETRFSAWPWAGILTDPGQQGPVLRKSQAPSSPSLASETQLVPPGCTPVYCAPIYFQMSGEEKEF